MEKIVHSHPERLVKLSLVKTGLKEVTEHGVKLYLASLPAALLPSRSSSLLVVIPLGLLLFHLPFSPSFLPFFPLTLLPSYHSFLPAFFTLGLLLSHSLSLPPISMVSLGKGFLVQASGKSREASRTAPP